MKQRTLAMMTGFEQYTRKTRRAIFLEEMEQVVPWGELCALVAQMLGQVKLRLQAQGVRITTGTIVARPSCRHPLRPRTGSSSAIRRCTRRRRANNGTSG